MVKHLFFFLSAIMLFGLCACAPQNNMPPETTVSLRDEAMPLKLLSSDVQNLPIGNNEMTYAQRRQLCVDFMELQVTAQWKPNVTVDFQTSNYAKGAPKQLSPDIIYGGLFYHSKGFGNPYRWLEYYDEATGIMDFERAIAENGGIGDSAAITDAEYDEQGTLTYKKYRSLMTFGNQCTSSTCWSWGRVINSVAFGDTYTLTVHNGYIPVGCYTYGYEYEGKTYDATTIRSFGGKNETNPLGYHTKNVIEDWIAANGDDAMYKCYAQMKPGDLLVNDGHALMVKQVNLYTTKDGSVDYAMSSVMVLEQIEAWAYEGLIQNVPFKKQGREAHGYTFESLQQQKYIPFTFAEFLDPSDPQDKAHLDYYHSYVDKLPGVRALYNTFEFNEETHGDSVEKAVTYCAYTKNSITASDFEQMVVGSNYSISDIFITVTDSSGTQLLKNIWRADYSNYREVSMSDHKCTWETDADNNLIPISQGVAALANGENLIEVTMQLCTGEKLTAYKGTLIP